jgi:hypothetical protein
MNPLRFPDDLDRLYELYMSAPPVPCGIMKHAIFAGRRHENVIYTECDPIEGFRRIEYSYVE